MAKFKRRIEMEEYILQTSPGVSKKELQSCSWKDLRDTYYAFKRADNLISN